MERAGRVNGFVPERQVRLLRVGGQATNRCFGEVPNLTNWAQMAERPVQGTGGTMRSGKQIRELREGRFVKSGDIERISRSIADVKGNSDFYVSHSSLADVETGSVPTQELAALPPVLRERLDAGRYRYAVVGPKDDTMGELIPAGSIVEVDVTQNAVQVFDWRSMRERPVYLVWHANGHSCCWCQLEGKELTLLPYPLSRQPVRRFRAPREASVIGRVTNAWLPFDQEPRGVPFH